MADQANKILSVQLDASKAVQGIAQLNRLIQEEKELMKQLTAENKKGSEQYAVAEKTVQELNRTKRQLQREIKAEVILEREQNGSLNQLRNQLSDLTKKYDQLSRAERENINVGGKLAKQINQVANEIKKAEEGTQRYYRNVGNYQNAILNAVGLNGRFASSIMNITSTSGGVSGAFGAMGSSVKAFGASLMGLLTNPVFLAIAGIAGVGMAFKWFYDYNEGLAEATRLTKEFTGYAGDDLLAMRNSIQATADVMGKDFKETLQSADTIMANFHVTGEEAMDIINKGFAAGADVNGDFLAKVQQLAPTFHDAGISASEMVAIITQTRSGIFTDQGLEAIKQGSARLREMSSTTRQALEGIGIDVNEMQRKMREGTMGTFEAVQQVSAQLKTLPNDAQEVGEVMSAVFGRQGKFASQEMIESLATMSTSLDEVKDKTGEYGDLLLENINTEEELDNVTSAIFDMTNKGWEEAKQKATIYAKQALVAVVKGLLDVTNWFIRLYNKSLVVRTGVQMIIASFNTLWQVVKFVFNVIVNAVNRMGDAFEALADVIEGVFSLDAKRVYQGWQKAEKAFKDGWSQLAKDAVSAGKAVGEGYANAVNNAVTGQLEELSIPAFSGAVGGGGSTGGGGGGGSSRTTGGGSKGSRGGRGRTSTPKKATTKSTTTTPKETPEQKAAREAEEAAQKKMNALIAEGEKLKMQALQERAKNEAKAIDELAEAQRQEIIKKYGTLEELQARLAKATTDADKAQAQGAIDGYNALMADVDKKRSDAITKMVEESEKARKEAEKRAQEDAKYLLQTWLDSTKEGTADWLKYQLDLLNMEKEAELQVYAKNEEMKQAITAKYAKQEEDLRRQNAQAIQQIEQTKYNAIATMVGGLGDVFSAFGEEQKEWLILQKTLALGEIMISQAVAIANAIKNASQGSITVWDMIAQIATGVTAVTTAMVQAFTALDSAKFATGGYISGAGTGTSDSIPIRVSNGESVMNANTTAMFSGLLSSLNQLGGGVPIQATQTASSVRGEDMLARAVAKGVAMLPAPVVSVEDINRGQRQVQVMNERATL